MKATCFTAGAPRAAAHCQLETTGDSALEPRLFNSPRATGRMQNRWDLHPYELDCGAGQGGEREQ